MVFEGVVERAVDSHRARGWVVGHGASHRATRGFVHFVDSTYVNGLAIIRLDFLDEIAIPVIDERGRLQQKANSGN